MQLLPFARQSRPLAPDYSGERLVNYFARPTDGVSPLALLSRGGLVQVVDLGAPVRAQVYMGGNHYAVAGGAVWKIVGGVATSVGTVADGVTGIAASTSEIAIVAGGNYYVCDGAATTQYTPGALTSARDVAVMDGYFLVIGDSGGRSDALQISGLDDGTTFNALEFAFAEKDPDGLANIIEDHDRLWLIGSRTIQVFYNSGNAQFPFEPVPGAVVEHGAIAWTTAQADNMVYWVRPDGIVLRGSGAAPQIISTPEVKAALEASTVTGGFYFTEAGHEFYAITRTGATSFVYDIATGLWHERSTGLDYGAWDAVGAVKINGQTYFGCAGGKIATASRDVFTDFGAVLMGEVSSAPVQAGADLFRVSRLHVNMGAGTVDIGRTPQVALEVSKDGRTWSSERWRDLPTLGKYYQRATWHALGQFRRANFRLSVTDPVPRDITGAKLTLG